MRRTFLLFLIWFFLMPGCTPVEKDLSRQALALDKRLRIACIGDGITLGYGIENRVWDCYPAQLQRLLGNKWQVKNFGVPFATVLEKGKRPYKQQPAYNKALVYNPDIVVIGLGSADTDSKFWEYRDYFIHNLKELIADFKALPSNPDIFLCYPPPSYTEEWKNGIPNNRLTNDIIPKIDKVAKEIGIPVIDLFQTLKDKPELFHDSVHPTSQGARLIAATVYNTIVRPYYVPAAGK